MSTIDHFIWPEHTGSAVLDAGVLHLIDNPSDHCPIYCIVDHLQLYKSEEKQGNFEPKPSWKRATDEQTEEFRLALVEKFKRLHIPRSAIDCSNVRCDKIEHKFMMDEYLENVLNIINSTAHECLPKPCFIGKFPKNVS